MTKSVKPILESLILVTFYCFPNLSFADNYRGVYLGGGAAKVDAFEFPQDERPLELLSSEYFAGYKYNAYLGLELRFGLGENSKSVRELSPSDQRVNITYQIDNYYSVYYKPETINDIAKLYGLFGYTSLKRSAVFRAQNGEPAAAFINTATTFGDAQVNGSELNDKSGAFSYGLGVGFILDYNFNINFEFRYLLRDSNERITLTGIYLDYRI